MRGFISFHIVEGDISHVPLGTYFTVHRVGYFTRPLSQIYTIEADGSRGHPLKAHAAHEPLIPKQAERILYVVGADGIGKKVIEAAHRPELYAKKTGKRQRTS
jgi:probable selenium-dependent hydroxylase accessory protein YqeC